MCRGWIDQFGLGWVDQYKDKNVIDYNSQGIVVFCSNIELDQSLFISR